MTVDAAELRSTILELLSDEGRPVTKTRLRNLLEQQEPVTIGELNAALGQLVGRVVVVDGMVGLGTHEDGDMGRKNNNGSANGTFTSEVVASGGTQFLECALTEEEIHEKRLQRETEDAEIAVLNKEAEGLGSRLKSIKKRIDVLLEDGAKASKCIRDRAEWKDVPCEERREPDQRLESATYGQTMIVTYRLDTHEAIDWRSLTASERQGGLFADGDTASA